MKIEESDIRPDNEDNVISATTTKKVVNILLDILSGHGVRMSVCSPGSRNIPLLLGIKAHHNIGYRVVTDERVAGFIALGMSVTTGLPVMMTCTSGTALLNYAPAVAEAFYQGIPLIVVSADRPEEWIDQDDSQTIRQYGALANIVKKSYDISDNDIERPDGQWYAERIFNDAMLVATTGKPGPVHINIRFAPPLGATEPVRPSTSRIIKSINPLCEPNRKIIRKLAEHALNSRILLVAGFMTPDFRMNRAVNKFRQHDNVVVMAETISNLHLPAEDYVIDTLLRDCKPRTPDLIISVGGALVSRMLKEYLRDIAVHNNLTHWSVGYNHTTVDCFKSLTSKIECDPATFIAQLSAVMAHLIHKKDITSPHTCYQSAVNEMRRESISQLSLQTEDAGWCEAQAFRYIM
ncbi:MAG: 2-succinyl-5-enolpyruvyl-6-hydroxy-3-cyclohexene-1-carboxylic-acid synthase, partial [Muribaculaceae bacterium]|nr:2-succinyl-5-enolpyruvyl-6-hydroxy-3-cyclohexene-1-carboxylic-acid synthase [Muribaculaceae bacterium]